MHVACLLTSLWVSTRCLYKPLVKTACRSHFYTALDDTEQRLTLTTSDRMQHRGFVVGFCSDKLQASMITDLQQAACIYKTALKTKVICYCPTLTISIVLPWLVGVNTGKVTDLQQVSRTGQARTSLVLNPL